MFLHTVLASCHVLSISRCHMLCAQVRGVLVGLLAHWAHDAIANADSGSVLFWGKLFKLANEDTYR